MHRLSDIDPVQQTGVCSECGPVRLKQSAPGRWRCRVAWNALNHRMPGRRARQRRYIKRKRARKSMQCVRCGFRAKHRAQIDVHHRDGNKRNNAPSNRESICANCHRLEHADDEKGPASGGR